MTDRINSVIDYVNNIFESVEHAGDRRAAYVHSYGVSQCCALLAAKRRMDPELAAAAGLLHDVYRFKTGLADFHAQNGAEMVRAAFKHGLAGLFSDEEQTVIKSAIYHHSDKGHIHDEYDELLKDGDVLQLLAFSSRYDRIWGQRLRNIFGELSLPAPRITILPKEKPEKRLFIRSRLGDIAEALAQKKIAGERSNALYMNIIRYFPEESAFDELKNGWCAAFVYHCCAEAGLSLPIRAKHTAANTAGSRFAGVGAWYEWGMDNGFCHAEKDAFTPRRGDIVIYNNIIPKEDKPENSRWHDHIGVVLSCEGDRLTVAEGNAGNKNVSGILGRERGDMIGCYLRIPEHYQYDGISIDFKTGREKSVELAAGLT